MGIRYLSSSFLAILFSPELFWKSKSSWKGLKQMSTVVVFIGICLTVVSDTPCLLSATQSSPCAGKTVRSLRDAFAVR